MVAYYVQQQARRLPIGKTYAMRDWRLGAKSNSLLLGDGGLIDRNPIPPMTVQEKADIHDPDTGISELTACTMGRFYAALKYPDNRTKHLAKACALFLHDMRTHSRGTQVTVPALHPLPPRNPVVPD